MIFLPFLRSSLRQPAFLPLAGLLFSASTLLHGQSVTYTGTSPALNFGTVNVCPSGATTPAPCSNTLALTYNVTGSGTLGIPKVVTEGAPNLDYTLASGSTCTGLVTQGTTCAVKVTLAPRYAGERKGAVEIVDASGNVLATTLVYGIGVAPQIAFDPAAQTTIGVAPSFPCFVAVDELGNVYLENYFYGSITKVLPDGGTPTSLGSGLNGPLAVALDGAGDVLIADNLKVWEVPADGGAQVVLPFTGVESPQDVAVDGSGNVFVSYYNFVGDDSVGAVAELPAGGDQITLPFTGLDIPYSLAVNNVGDVFVSDYDVTGPVRAAYIFELPASGGGQTMLPFPYAVQGQLAADSAGDLFVGDSPQIMQLPAGASVPIAISDFPSTAAADQNVAVSSAGDVYATLTNLNLVELHRSQPPSLSFPETALGTTSIPLSVQIQNIGNAALSLSGMNASGPFAVVPGSGTPADCTTSSSLAPGAQCNLSITFKPESEGLVTGALTLSDNSLNNNPANQVIQLSGVIGDPPQAQLSATKLSFGHVPYPAGSTLPLTITNVGGGTLTIAPSINGPSYTIAGSTCGAGVTAGNSCTLQVQYLPVAIGYHDDILTLVTNGSLNNGPTNITVPLQALATGVGALETESPLQFGTVPLGNTEVLPLTIYNYGVPGTVTVGTKINGPSYTIIGSTCTAGVTAGNTCTLQVQFNPVEGGYHDDILTITPSGLAAPTTVCLKGFEDYDGG